VHRRGGLGVGGQERLDRQLRERHLHRRAEDEGGGEERQRLASHPHPERRHHVGRRSARRPRHGAAVALRLGQEVDQHRIGGELDLVAQARQHVGAPFGEVEDVGRDAPRVQAEADDVDRRRQQRRIDAVEELRQRAVAHHHVPAPVEGEGRIGPVPVEDDPDRLARRGQFGRGQAALGEDGRIAGRDQQHVALAHRHLQPLGQPQHHLAAGRGAAGLDEAEMARGDLRLAGQVELAHAPAAAPFAQVISDGRRGHGHPLSIDRRRRPLQ